jgi:hypothetical protein
MMRFLAAPALQHFFVNNTVQCTEPPEKPILAILYERSELGLERKPQKKYVGVSLLFIIPFEMLFCAQKSGIAGLKKILFPLLWLLHSC